MLIKRIEIKKSKFCTGASIVICIAMSSVKKTLKPKTIREPPIIKKPALTREIIIQLTMAIFGWTKLNEGFAESEVIKRGFDLRRPTGLHSDLGCFQAVSVPVSTLSGLSHRFHWGPRPKKGRAPLVHKQLIIFNVQQRWCVI